MQYRHGHTELAYKSVDSNSARQAVAPAFVRNSK